MLLESFDVPIELDEQNQQESDYENELDEDDGHYKEAIPPAPKLQGTIPRADTNATQTISTKKQATGSSSPDNSIKSDSMENQRSFSEGLLSYCYFIIHINIYWFLLRLYVIRLRGYSSAFDRNFQLRVQVEI